MCLCVCAGVYIIMFSICCSHTIHLKRDTGYTTICMMTQLEKTRSRWVSPAMVVRKPDGSGFRLAVDLHTSCESTAQSYIISKQSIRNWMVPSISSTWCIKGFWGLPLSKASQEIPRDKGRPQKSSWDALDKGGPKKSSWDALDKVVPKLEEILGSFGQYVNNILNIFAFAVASPDNPMKP